MVSNAAYWLLEECLGAAYLGSAKYYLDWAGDNRGCIQDSDPSFAPDYMAQLGYWFFETLEESAARRTTSGLFLPATSKALPEQASGMLTGSLGNASRIVLDQLAEILPRDGI
jgi:hypothetical protein